MSATGPLVSVVIVDYKRKNPYLTECLDHLLKQTFRNFEALLLTDYPVALRYPKLRKKYYGHYVGPAVKRDDGAKLARGKIVAFIDDDAYPREDWLENIIKNFSDEKVAAVGGPGVTPPNVALDEALSGWVSASPLGGGWYISFRFLPGTKKDIDDYPSMNLTVRKADFLAVGGFDSNYWPGEDTKLCLDITQRLKKRIVYDPNVVVFHHRRPLLVPHLRQHGNFGIHRGNFARILPETSLRFVYFAPSLMVLGLTFLVIFFVIQGFLSTFPFFPFLQLVFTVGVGLTFLYLSFLVVNGIWVFSRSKNLVLAFLSVPGVFVTHFWYGARFIQGFLSPAINPNSNQKKLLTGP